MTFWFIALIFGLVLAIRDFIGLNHAYRALKQEKYSLNPSNRSNNVHLEDEAARLAALKKKEVDLYLNFLKIFGDLVPSSQGSEIFPKLFGKNLNDGVIGLGGTVSAAIAAYQAY